MTISLDRRMVTKGWARNAMVPKREMSNVDIGKMMKYNLAASIERMRPKGPDENTLANQVEHKGTLKLKDTREGGRHNAILL